MARTMPKSTPKKPKKDERSQRDRFIEFAREHGADDPDALDRALGEVEKKKAKPKK